MNRSERRRLERRGIIVPKEPVLMMKPSEIGKAATQGVGKESMVHEINQQILNSDKRYQLDIDSMVLWSLRKFAGWGPKKLKCFYEKMLMEHLRMREFYEMDRPYPERYTLKDEGVDIEAWYDELFDEEGNYRTL